MKKTGHTVEELIRLEAYLLSEREGHPHGKERMFWVQAEAIVHGRSAAVAPSHETRPTKKTLATVAKSKSPAKAALKHATAPAAKSAKQLPLVAVIPAPASAKPAAKKTTKTAAPKAKSPAKPASKAK